MIQDIIDNPEKIDFFQAVRLIEADALHRAAIDPDLEFNLIGEGNIPWKEAIRFHAEQSLAFPTHEVSRVKVGKKHRPQQKIDPLHLYVTFMGLTGPSGALPTHYTEMLLERVHLRDPAMRDFFDLFNHRLISLFYRAWKKNHFYIGYEESKIRGDKKRDDFSQMILSLAGIGTSGLENRLSVDDDVICYHAQHFVRPVHTAQGLASIVADYFDVAVDIEQFVGQWISLDDDECTRMPSQREPKGLNNQLGMNTIIGKRIWHCQNSFRVVLGPLSSDEFKQFLPDGEAFIPLCDLIRTYAGPEFNFDVRLIAEPIHLPNCYLSSAAANDDDAYKPRLGWNVWLGAPPRERFIKDAILASVR